MKTRNSWLLVALLAVFGVMFGGFVPSALAQTDCSSVITTLGGYETSALVIGVAILLWMVGRRIVKRMI